MSQKSAKRRRREQRLQQEQESINSQHKVEHLEVLLKAGDIDGYAQACWALANNRDEAPIAGEVVTLSGPCEEHGMHEKSFRLTPQTLMIIAQLIGMETCGEAIRLVAKKVPPEKLPCYPHGHREQAYEQIMLGVEPAECIYCGDTPEFILPSKSIGWPDEIPVKGIDGQEYKTCPNCNSEYLEIEGEKLGQWGWKITCMDCHWEIKQAELLDIRQYCDQIEIFKTALHNVRSKWNSEPKKTQQVIEDAGVATRKLLEKIAFATLISNKDNSGKTREEMEKWWNPRKILNEIGKVHPDCFPKPVEIDSWKQDPKKPFRLKTKEVLNKERVIKIYKELNPLAHSTNPLADQPDYERYREMIPKWLDLIANTMEVHQVRLFHHTDHFYVVKMSGDRDGSVQCTTFTRNAEDAVTCAWPECVSNTARAYCELWSKPWSDCLLPQKDDDQTNAKKFGASLDAKEAEEHIKANWQIF